MDVWMDFQAFEAAAVWGKSFIDAKLDGWGTRGTDTGASGAVCGKSFIDAKIDGWGTKGTDAGASGALMVISWKLHFYFFYKYQ